MGIIDILKSVSASGLAKPSRYKVQFTLPNIIGTTYTADDSILLSTYTFSVGIPASNYLTYDWVSKGVPIKLPYQKNYSDLITNHYVDGKNLTRRMMQDWHELVMDNGTNNFNYLKEYMGNITINQYSAEGYDEKDLIAIWQIDNIWPSIIGQEQLAYDANDQLLTFDVTWTYNIVQLELR